MRRILEHWLHEWKRDPARKSLLVRGARQVGKTFTINKFGETFESAVEVNFEKTPELGSVFDQDLDPRRLVRDLALACNQAIQPGRTLLFLDEIQQVPRALTALRYFHEDLPELHVVAAGSLIDFAVEEVGIPVGRVTSLYLYPVSFMEFLAAKGETLAVAALAEHDPREMLGEAVHRRMLGCVGEYLAVGGMPEAIREWLAHQDLKRCSLVHSQLADTYRQDFAKYSRKHQVKYVDLVFNEVPRFLGQKFVFSRLSGNWRRRDLQPAMDLLTKAGVVHSVSHSAARGLPLGAEMNPERFKLLFLDVGLAQSVLGFDGSKWILDRENAFVNAGELVEAFVGQELLAYSPAYREARLHYWHREARSSNAEVDYVIAAGETVIPIEVKSGTRGQLKSMGLFLESRRQLSPYGARFSTHNYSVIPKLRSYPLYAVGTLAAELDETMLGAIRSLF